jgi:hypothetical protein
LGAEKDNKAAAAKELLVQSGRLNRIGDEWSGQKDGHEPNCKRPD